jgi:hypothetical protein
MATGARNIFIGRFGFLELYQPNGYDAIGAAARPGVGRRIGRKDAARSTARLALPITS